MIDCFIMLLQLRAPDFQDFLDEIDDEALAMARATTLGISKEARECKAM